MSSFRYILLRDLLGYLKRPFVVKREGTPQTLNLIVGRVHEWAGIDHLVLLSLGRLHCSFHLGHVESKVFSIVLRSQQVLDFCKPVWLLLSEHLVSVLIADDKRTLRTFLNHKVLRRNSFLLPQPCESSSFFLVHLHWLDALPVEESVNHWVFGHPSSHFLAWCVPEHLCLSVFHVS